MEKALITPQYVRVKLMHYTRSFISPAPRGSQTLARNPLLPSPSPPPRPFLFCQIHAILVFLCSSIQSPLPSLTWGPASPLFLPFFAPLGPPSLNFDAHSHLPQNQLSSLSIATTRRPWDIFLPFLPLFRFPCARECSRADISDSETGKGERARFRGQRGLKVPEALAPPRK